MEENAFPPPNFFSHPKIIGFCPQIPQPILQLVQNPLLDSLAPFPASSHTEAVSEWS